MRDGTYIAYLNKQIKHYVKFMSSIAHQKMKGESMKRSKCKTTTMKIVSPRMKKETLLRSISEMLLEATKPAKVFK